MSRKEQIKALILREVRQVLPTDRLRVFLFGSQANRPELKAADIDVGIDAGRRLAFAELLRLKAVLEDSPDMIRSFDVVDFHAADAGFAAIALQNIELIHDDTTRSAA